MPTKRKIDCGMFCITFRPIHDGIFALNPAWRLTVKYRIELDYNPFPPDKMWIEVELNDQNIIIENEDRFGRGNVKYTGEGRSYSLYENSDKVVGLGWTGVSKKDEAGELHILKQRLAVGGTHLFVDRSQRYYYTIKKSSHSRNPLRRFFALNCISS